MLKFQVAADECEKKTGSVKINNGRFIYSRSEYEPFMTFDGKVLSIDRMKTYQFYNPVPFFKSQEEFFQKKGISGHIILLKTLSAVRGVCLSMDRPGIVSKAENNLLLGISSILALIGQVSLCFILSNE